jgi:DNA-binding MarR family transcriptional regulator
MARGSRLSRVHDEHVARNRGGMSKQELAQSAWRLLMRVAEKHMEEAGERLGEMGLSPVQGHFLDELAKLPPGPMSQLVARMDVDPGWVTDIVDRLEKRGDVVRKPSPEDRRVKILELTERGRESWREMDDTLFAAPSELMELTGVELLVLLKIAQRLARASNVEFELSSLGSPERKAKE